MRSLVEGLAPSAWQEQLVLVAQIAVLPALQVRTNPLRALALAAAAMTSTKSQPATRPSVLQPVPRIRICRVRKVNALHVKAASFREAEALLLLTALRLFHIVTQSTTSMAMAY
jgi:hypothetical protein